MKGKLSRYLFSTFIVFFLVLICIGSLVHGKKQIDAVQTEPVTFNEAQTKFLENSPQISIYVDPALRYLFVDLEQGFLYEYMQEIFQPYGVSFQLTEDTDADCGVWVVTDQIRRKSAQNSYTSPLFQLEGAFFLRDGKTQADELSGVVMAERMTAQELAETRYGDAALDVSPVDGAQNAVNEARRCGGDFIIGDRSAILYALGGETDYIPAEKALYSMNVCIVAKKSDDTLYSILNECINHADRHALSYELGEKWLNGNGPLYMKDRYEEFSLLLLIIASAVLIVFFIYYQANKNLYRELNDRMVQLAASKQELKTTFNGVGYYLAELELGGGIKDINRAFYHFVSTDTANRKIWDVIDMKETDRDRLRELVRQAAESGQRGSIEVLLLKQTLVLTVFPIENAKGAVEKLLFMGMDVTRERMAERQMLQDNKMIAVGQLAAGIAHEIRNPLGIIRNYCYVLKTMENEKVRAKAIEQIEKAVDASGTIINSLLDFSRVSSCEKSRIDVEAHINALMTLNQSILKKKKIQLSVVCDEPVETFLAVQSLDMILINLVSNAIDAMQDNGNLCITVIKYRKEFEIEVQDSGAGIEKTVLEEIFNPFFTTKGSSGGTGLGLYIVYNEVKKMNGEISVDSTLGKGSRFKLIFPLDDGENAKEDTDDEGNFKDLSGR